MSQISDQLDQFREFALCNIKTSCNQLIESVRQIMPGWRLGICMGGETVFDRIKGVTWNPGSLKGKSIEQIAEIIQNRVDSKSNFLLPTIAMLALIFVVGWILGWFVIKGRKVSAKLCFCTAIFYSNALCAQDSSDFFVPKSDTELYFEFALPLNEYSPVVRQNSTYTTSIELLSILSRESVIKDLDIVDSQVIEIRKAAKSLQEGQESFNSLEKAVDSDVKRFIESPLIAASKVLNESMLPHQFSRLKQILLQFEIRQIGIEAAVKYGTLSLDPIIRKGTHVRDDFREKCQQLEIARAEEIERFDSSVLGVLSSSQKRRLEDISGSPGRYSVPLIFLTVQAEKEFDEFYQSFRDLDFRWKTYSCLALPMSAKIGLDSKVIFDTVSREYVADYVSYRKLIFLLSNRNDISPSCKTKVLELEQSWRELNSDLERQREAWIGTYQDFKRYMNNQRLDFIDKRFPILEEILKNEAKNLESIICKYEIENFGLAFAISKGSLNATLAIQPNQLHKLDILLREYSPKAKRFLAKQENELVELFVKTCLDDDGLALFNEKIGDWVCDSEGLVEFHQAINDYPDADWLVKDVLRRNHTKIGAAFYGFNNSRSTEK